VVIAIAAVLDAVDMKTRKLYSPLTEVVSVSLAVALLPNAGWACACGCGVFDVGTSSMFPTSEGFMVFFNYAYQDQNHNWNGTSEAPTADNDDREIETHFFTVGIQYMLNRSWGVEAEVPYDFRYFRTAETSVRWDQVGDVRLRGLYTGFFPDLSAGVTFGVKLPTGDFKFEPDVVDRDTQLGTGSTDILLGGYFRHNLGKNQRWDWFAQLELDVPVLIQDEYRPGVELDTAAGIDYMGFKLGRTRISPVAQVIFTERTSDSGANSANPTASGYQRILLSPGVELHIHPFKIYADAEFPVYQNFTGNQLAAPFLVKASISYMF
jgi:hypothetical protein